MRFEPGDIISDGTLKYEVAWDRLVENYGLLGGMLRVVIVRHMMLPDNRWQRLGNRLAAVAKKVLA